MNAQDQADAYLARRIRRALPGGATHRKCLAMASERVLKISHSLKFFDTECTAVQEACAINLADAPPATVRQYVSKRGEGYRLFNVNQANQTLSEVDIHVGQVPIAARAKAAELEGQAFNQVQIYGLPFVWKPKP